MTGHAPPAALDDRGSGTTRRMRLLLLALAVAVVGLVLSQVLLRTGGSGASAQTPVAGPAPSSPTISASTGAGAPPGEVPVVRDPFAAVVTGASSPTGLPTPAQASSGSSTGPTSGSSTGLATGSGRAAGTVTVPGREVTVTVPGPEVTATVPGPGVTATVPGPGVTVTVPGPGLTVTVPGPETTVTAPGPTVALPGPTVTVPGPPPTTSPSDTSSPPTTSLQLTWRGPGEDGRQRLVLDDGAGVREVQVALGGPLAAEGPASLLLLVRQLTTADGAPAVLVRSGAGTVALEVGAPHRFF